MGRGGGMAPVQIGFNGAQELVEFGCPGCVQSFVGGRTEAQEVGVGGGDRVEHMTHERTDGDIVGAVVG